ncbi:MAG: leucyl aminopeptidase [Rhodothermales bacterium]|nr:leucyl aminopeptidase [Rhodothermales bacterium]MCA0269234.1 leucyl aminopeptidase [Bacteroidota bacterium]
MKVSVTSLPLNELDVDVVAIPLTAEATQTTLGHLADGMGEGFRRALDDFDGSKDRLLMVYPDKARTKRFLLVGLGDEAKVDAEALRRCAAKVAAEAKTLKADTVAFTMPDLKLDADTMAQALVEGFMLASYRFLRYKSDGDGGFKGTERIVLHAEKQEKAGRRGGERGRDVAEAVLTARDLVNRSPNEKTATMLGKEFERMGKKHGFEVAIWDKAVIEEEKMGGLLAVNLGSTEPPAFAVLEYTPENPVNERPVILVGKGVTFDTGGLSLKPTPDSMDHMKADMSGAAAVAGTFEAIARLKLPLHVIGLIPMTDNRPGENAYVPGDVITMHSGKTVEVLNTDAEGRLILADALSYAKTFKPELVIDIATLTGAQVIALGSDVGAAMTNQTDAAWRDRLDAIERAGERSGDLVHRLPTYDFYARQLDTEVADMKNIGGREAGTITAAKFLEAFTDYPWLHLDIAGPAFLSKAKPYRPAGGTGFGVRLIVEFLREYASPKKTKK